MFRKTITRMHDRYHRRRAFHYFYRLKNYHELHDRRRRIFIKTIAHLEKIQKKVSSDNWLIVECQLKVAQFYEQTGKPHTALSFYTKSYLNARFILTHKNNAKGNARYFAMLVASYARIQQRYEMPKQAIEYFKEALSALEGIEAKIPSDYRECVFFYAAVAQLYKQQNKPKNAYQFYMKASEALKNIEILKDEDNRALAEYYGEMIRLTKKVPEREKNCKAAICALNAVEEKSDSEYRPLGSYYQIMSSLQKDPENKQYYQQKALIALQALNLKSKKEQRSIDSLKSGTFSENEGDPSLVRNDQSLISKLPMLDLSLSDSGHIRLHKMRI